MSIRRLLLILAVFNPLVFVVIFIFFISHNNLLTERTENMINVDQALLITLNDMYAYGLQTGQATRNVILNPGDNMGKANYQKANTDFIKSNNAAITLAKDETRKTLEEIRSYWFEDDKLKVECQQIAISADMAKATRCIIDRETPKWREIRTRLLALIDRQRKIFKATLAENEKVNARSNKILGGAIILSLMVSTLFIYFVRMNIGKPLQKIIRVLRDFDNDLTIEIPVRGKTELDELARWINSYRRNLHNVISMVSDTVTDVSFSANEISEALEKQASVSSEQTASLSEITSTMEELSASSGQISENSNSVLDISNRAFENTRKGDNAIKKLAANMDDIHSDSESGLHEIMELGNKSKDITKVMAMINSIADNTKMIAFNAAIEAFGAGEAGKRFSVVATEIRRLADNVMDSTGEIGSKLVEMQGLANNLAIASEKSVTTIQDGLTSTNETTSILAEIVGGARATTDAAKEISLSTHQQVIAIEQVVLALREIEEGSRHTSTSIKQIYQICKNLTILSNNLKDMVNKFKLEKA
ncbi:MAG: methyl-accepting chemotaxis protein [Nitrospirae bacterium]|nr:methyl-accepting chemotaxis protein [Nitrospirota bacterium]